MYRIVSLCFVALCSSSALAEVAHVDIPAEVQVQGENILLSEVAPFDALSPGLRKLLEPVSLGPAPRLGQTVTWPGSTVLTRLRSRVDPATYAEIEWNVAPRVTFHRVSSRVPRAQILEALDVFVQTRGPKTLTPILDDVRFQTPVLCSPGAVELSFETVTGKPLLGPTSLTLLVQVDGRIESRVPVQLRIDGELQVVITTRALPRGHEIGPDDLHEELRRISSVGESPVSGIENAVGKVTSRALSPNQVLQLRDVENKPVVKRGDPVTILLRSGNMVVTCPGEAREDGIDGDMISVRNLMTDNEIRGRVVNDGVVELDYRPPPTLVRGTANLYE